MKLSVIVGVIHMSIGIIIKGTNAVFFRRWAVLFTEVITGLIILLGLFGWMDFLIYAKWFKRLDIEDKTVINQEELDDKLNQDIEARPEYAGDWQNRHTPSVINIMITTIFNGGQYPDTEKDYVPLVGDSQDEQYSIALSLLIIAVCLIPVMLLVKPCFFSAAAHADAEQEIEMMNSSMSQMPHTDSYASYKSGKKNIKSIDQ
jgi:V-type H+-transporting ATPase subunit a